MTHVNLLLSLGSGYHLPSFATVYAYGVRRDKDMRMLQMITAIISFPQRLILTYLNKARVNRRTSHVPNLMLMSKLYCSTSFVLDSAHVKFDV